MTQALDQRVGYHPHPRGCFWQRGFRRVRERSMSISRHIDINDKTILDLGCSGGYFSFMFSKKARHVLAVDADDDMIRRNLEISIKYGYENITFRHTKITPEFIRSLPEFDVILFLSVFQHMLTASEVYDWNEVNAQDEAFKVLSAIREKAKVLVFEMGYPDEEYEWCERLPKMLPNPHAWIIQNVFGSDFKKIRVISHPAYQGLWGRTRGLFAKQKMRNVTVARVIRRLFSLDKRDRRDIFIGMKE